MLLPFALISYPPALALWLAATLGFFLRTLWRIAPVPFTLFAALGFPGTLLNFAPAQNGFLTAGLLGGGLLLLENSPFLGGALLGLLVYKPHLAVLIPLALAAGGRWRALLGAAAAALTLSLASLAVCGVAAWEGFFRSLPVTYHLLATGAVPLHQMPSPFAALRLAGVSQGAALALQYVVMAAVAAAVAWTWRRAQAAYLRHAALVLGTLLFSPYLFYYDYALLALPLAWLGWAGGPQGLPPGEKTLLTLGWLAPFLLVPFQWGKPPLWLCPLLVLALLLMVLWKSRRSGPVG